VPNQFTDVCPALNKVMLCGSERQIHNDYELFKRGDVDASALLHSINYNRVQRQSSVWRLSSKFI
jgi:hypothetical protein